VHGRDEKFVKNLVGEFSGKTPVERNFFVKMAVTRVKGMAKILVGSY
jgi:hypothetical protein